MAVRDWIVLGEVKPIDYYLSLLGSNGTQPYVELGEELQKLPDLTNATAVAKITYLALNATNPEAKEALSLMMKGGTPYPRDYTYSVPNYNTELQVLYWLACQNEFRKEDTLALGIAVANGIWVTMGEPKVVETVRRDANSLLVYLREVNALQEKSGWYPLENYPLEAKIAIGWTGEESMRHGYGPPISLVYWTNKQVPIEIYDACTVSINTLLEMRNEAEKNGWMQRSAEVNSLVSNVEDYLFFPSGPHFTYRTDYDKIVNDQGIMAVHDVDWQWAQYKKGLKFQGDCGTEMTIVDAWLKSCGISTVCEWTYTLFVNRDMEKFSHSFIIYYEPTSRTWKSYSKQLSQQMSYWTLKIGGTLSQPFDMFICRPPVIQQRYLKEISFQSRTINGTFYASYWHFQGNMYYLIELTPWAKLQDMLSQGIPTATMKQWLFYTPPAF